MNFSCSNSANDISLIFIADLLEKVISRCVVICLTHLQYFCIVYKFISEMKINVTVFKVANL